MLTDKSYRLQTIEEAKEYIRIGSKSNKGVICPCCEQFVKVYKRKITSAAAKALMLLIQETVRLNKFTNELVYSEVHIQDFFAGIGLRATAMDYIQLERFGLIQKVPDDRTEKEKKEIKNVGLYFVTDRGYKFATNQIAIEKYHYVLNNKSIGVSKVDKVRVYECLKEKHTYADLMKGIPIKLL